MFGSFMFMVVMRFQAVLVILDKRKRGRRLEVLIIVLVVILAVSPGVDLFGSVIINMVVWLVLLLVPVIVLGFGIKW